MNCNRVVKSLSMFLDGLLPESDRRAVSRHLGNCRECLGRCEDLRGVRASLRELPAVAAPANLMSQLQVMASHEIARRQGERDFSSGFRRWVTRAGITVNDLMRPLALPAAGGVLSSVVFFVMLVDTFAFQQVKNDIPLGINTQATVDELSPFGFSGRDVTVELNIDKDGHFSSYSVAHGTFTRDDMKQLGNLILFTTFAPATASGQPISGKVLVRSPHHINVRG